MSQKSATIALLNSGKVLLLKRGSSAPWQPNKFCLIGGGIDRDESLLDAALREANEEVGINLDKNSIKDITVNYNNGYSKVVFFAEDIKCPIVLNYEHSEYGWFTYGDCLKMYNQKMLVPRLLCVLKNLFQKGLIV